MDIKIKKCQRSAIKGLIFNLQRYQVMTISNVNPKALIVSFVFTFYQVLLEVFSLELLFCNLQD